MHEHQIMLFDRATVATCLSLALSASALAQQQHAEPKIIEIESSGAGVLSSRQIQTRTTTADSDVVTETIQTPDVDGRWQPSHEVTTETIGKDASTTRVRQDVYTYGVKRQRVLLERTEADQVRSSDGGVQTVSRTWRADLNGVLNLTSQVTEDRGSSGGASETTTRVFAPDVNGRLSEAAQMSARERQLSSGTTQRETSVLRRDLNGRWQPVEMRQADARDDGPAEHLEEEIVSRPDLSDAVGISERTVTRRTQANGREYVLIERYVPRDAGAMHRSASRMDLSERVRVTTTTATDGTRETIEEVEARSPVAAGDPMRVRRRVVTTVRPLGGDQSVVEQQTFDLDANGRLVLTATERREGSLPQGSRQSTTRDR